MSQYVNIDIIIYEDLKKKIKAIVQNKRSKTYQTNKPHPKHLGINTDTITVKACAPKTAGEYFFFRNVKKNPFGLLVR